MNNSFDQTVWLLKYFLALAVVLLLVFLLLKFFSKRFNKQIKNTRCKIIETIKLDHKITIYIIEIDNSLFLMAANHGSISMCQFGSKNA